ncbi:MAG: hypothetical protein IPK83_15685 [Planctomycetes bacterium]|nr:hypothetical protein [Planctomycetota bacterium]
MSTLPRGRTADFLEWCQAHVPVFDQNAEEIGLTKAQAGDFAATTVKAQASLLNQHEAEQAARAATLGHI